MKKKRVKHEKQVAAKDILIPPRKRRRSARVRRKSNNHSSSAAIVHVPSPPTRKFHWSFDFWNFPKDKHGAIIYPHSSIPQLLVYPLPDPLPPPLLGKTVYVDVAKGKLGMLIDVVVCSDCRPRVLITAMKRNSSFLGSEVRPGDFIIGMKGMPLRDFKPENPQEFSDPIHTWPRPVTVEIFRPDPSTPEGRWHTSYVMSGAPYGTVMEGNRLIEEKKHGQTLNISDSASEVKKNCVAESSVDQPIELLDSSDEESDGEEQPGWDMPNNLEK